MIFFFLSFFLFLCLFFSLTIFLLFTTGFTTGGFLVVLTIGGFRSDGSGILKFNLLDMRRKLCGVCAICTVCFALGMLGCVCLYLVRFPCVLC